MLLFKLLMYDAYGKIIILYWAFIFIGRLNHVF